jgi:hypothetical protein
MNTEQMPRGGLGKKAGLRALTASAMPRLAQNAGADAWAARPGIEPSKTMVMEFATEALKAS